MKKLSCLFLSILITAALLPCTAYAAESEPAEPAEATELPEDSVDMLLFEQASTSGDYKYEKKDGKTVITGYIGAGGDITIPSKLGGSSVSVIGFGAFQGNVDITSVTLPSTVTDIEQSAFQACKNLKSIKWSSKLKNIEHFAFEECTSLTTLDLPSKLEVIGAHTFNGCTGVTSITLPASLKEVGNDAFTNTYNLKELNYNAESCSFPYGNAFRYTGQKAKSLVMKVGDGVLDIPVDMFFSTEGEYAAITELSISDSVKTIGSSAFQYCKKLKKVTLGNGLETIDEYAFADCTALKSITFPDSLQVIGSYAFKNDTGITQVILPASVLEAKEAFRACTNLKSIVVYGDTEFENNDFYDAAYGVTIYCYPDTKVDIMATDCGNNVIYLSRSKYFKDVPPTHSYQFAVYECVDYGIVSGYKDGTFGINENVTRGQVMVMLWRLANKPEPESLVPKFKDVPATHSYFKAIQWGVEQGITGGYTGSKRGYFGPKDNCTRGQIVTFLWRAAGKPEPKTSGQSFTDVPVTHNFYKPIQWASDYDITAGYKDGTFGVNKTCTRGHCVTFIYRMLANGF